MLSTIALDTQVIQKGLCTGCGACQGLCPYWGSRNGQTVCYFDCERRDGRCQAFCPKMPTDWDALRGRFFPETEIIPELGPFRGLYLTRAADPSIRAKAQHGGTVTALLTLALRENIIDAAVLTRSQGGLSPEGTLALTEEEVRACSGSSFQIPPTLAVLNRTLAENQYHRIGVVGTPCKTRAVYKMRAELFPEHTNHAENIALILGLFCGWGLDWDGLPELVQRHTPQRTIAHMDIPPSQYHCLELQKDNGETVAVNLDEVLPLVRSGCTYCPDMTAEFADISIGGARSADGWDIDQGWNQVIVRSKQGQDVLDLAFKTGVLEQKAVPDTAIEKLKGAAMGKRHRAQEHLARLT